MRGGSTAGRCRLIESPLLKSRYSLPRHQTRHSERFPAAIIPRSTRLSTNANPHTIRIGLLSGEPIRLEGLRTVFEASAAPGKPELVPVVGSLDELLENAELEYLVIDLNADSEGLKTLESVRRARPGMRQIVIGTERDDELVLEAITAGARAFLDSLASPDTVRMAIDVVVNGSIWAPRRLLSKLIDRLLGVGEGGGMPGVGQLQLTDRERQVMELILLAQSNREIARQLGIEERTVKAHVGRLMRKTGAENRIELSIMALNRRSQLTRVKEKGEGE